MEPVTINLRFDHDETKKAIAVSLSPVSPINYPPDLPENRDPNTSMLGEITLTASSHGFAHLYGYIVDFILETNPDYAYRLTADKSLTPGSPDLVFQFDPALDRLPDDPAPDDDRANR